VYEFWHQSTVESVSWNSTHTVNEKIYKNGDYEVLAREERRD